MPASTKTTTYRVELASGRMLARRFTNRVEALRAARHHHGLLIAECDGITAYWSERLNGFFTLGSDD